MSPDHAVYIGDVLIPVNHQVNGSAIEQVMMDDMIDYRVELPRHAVLSAGAMVPVVVTGSQLEAARCCVGGLARRAVRAASAA